MKPPPPQSVAPPGHVYSNDVLAPKAHEERHTGSSTSPTERRAAVCPPGVAAHATAPVPPDDAGDTAARWWRTCAAAKSARSGAR